MKLTPEYLDACRERFEELWWAESDPYCSYRVILGCPPVSLGWQTFFKEHGGAASMLSGSPRNPATWVPLFRRGHGDTESMPNDSSWMQAIWKWVTMARRIRTPCDEFERRCLELAAYRLSDVKFAPPSLAAALDLRSKILVLQEELFLTRPFPERLVWSVQLPLSLSLFLYLINEAVGDKTLEPLRVTRAIAATQSHEISEEHGTLRALRSGEWKLRRVARLLDSTLRVHGERSDHTVDCHGLVMQCVEGHCLLLGLQEEIRAKEHPVEQDKLVAYLIGYLAYRETPFRCIPDIIDNLPSNDATEPLKGEEAAEGVLEWNIVRGSCLSFLEEVEHLMKAAMNEDAPGAIEALRAIKRHAEKLAKLKSGEEGVA